MLRAWRSGQCSGYGCTAQALLLMHPCMPLGKALSKGLVMGALEGASQSTFLLVVGHLSAKAPDPIRTLKLNAAEGP